YNFGTVGEVNVQSYAVFAEATWHFVEQWGLVFGLRQTWDKKSGQTTLLSSFTNALSPPMLAINLPETKWDAFTPRISLHYTPADDVMLFVTASKGFRSGGWSGEGATAAQISVPFDPEYAWNYEAGIKSRWFGD